MFRKITTALALLLISACSLMCAGQPGGLEIGGMFPENGAASVNPDTYLKLTFAGTPTLLNTGTVRICNASTDQLVDELDLSIPPGPKNTRTPAPYDSFVYAGMPDSLYMVNSPDKDTTHLYQLNQIGGPGRHDAYHFYPVLLDGNAARIYPHHHRLEYGETYYVLIEKGMFILPDGEDFAITDKKQWTFTVKSDAPAAEAPRLIVSADGTGDFTTVQGAIDFIPRGKPAPVTIYIKNGIYEEIVNCVNRHQLKIIGESRENVIIRYPNNGVFNTKIVSPDPLQNKGYHNMRAVMAVYDSSEMTVADLTLHCMGEAPAQAEALLIKGDKMIVDNVSMEGSGDALQANGRIYVHNSKIQGFGDNVLGYGAVFFQDCDFVSTYGPHLWVRNTDKNHGNVLVNCTLRTIGDVETHIARAPDNHGIKYPYCEAVLIDCKLDGIRPEGWGRVTDNPEHVRYWEYNSTDLHTGQPVDVSRRHPASRQLTMENDAELINSYRNPAYVLQGWSPSLER